MTQDRNNSRGAPSAQNTGSTSGQDALAVRLGELARELQHESGTSATLEYLVRAAVDLIPGAEQGSISVVTARKNSASQYPTGPLPTVVDRIQTELGEGPCMDAVFEQQTVRVDDLASTDRWPRFAPRAVEAGALSMLAFQLYVEGDNLGALNMFSSRADVFDDESEHVGLLFATHAAIAFAATQEREQLQSAMASRDMLGQAKGILMERYAVTAEQAFLILTRLSQESNVKLRDIAQTLVSNRTLPSTR